MLKDRVILITNVEKFAGFGTTQMALAEGAHVLAHDPAFEASAARRKYENQFPGAHALVASEPVAMVDEALKRHGRIDALVNNDAFPALRAPIGEARLEDFRTALEVMAVTPFRLVQLVAPSMRPCRFSASSTMATGSLAPRACAPGNWFSYLRRAAEASNAGSCASTWAPSAWAICVVPNPANFSTLVIRITRSFSIMPKPIGCRPNEP